MILKHRKKLILLICFLGISLYAQEEPPAPTKQKSSNRLLYKTEKASNGYTLLAPMTGTKTYLVDSDGNAIHAWNSKYRPGRSAYLLEDGTLLRACQPGKRLPRFQKAGGTGGRVQRLTWEGDVAWDYICYGENFVAHHDIEPLPDGNVLILIWEHKTREQALEAGRNPAKINGEGVWVDGIIEVKPTSETEGEIVWKWSAWDHLIQDHSKHTKNYGEVAAHPEKIDFNYVTRDDEDWAHVNSIDYNEELDQIVLSAHAFSELWIIDHSTTTKEAATSQGGQSGRGGDLLYRWGNPQAYRRGTKKDRILYRQHDVQWIAKGRSGEGNLLLFNNGWGRLPEEYSSIIELTPPLLKTGLYRFPEKKHPYGPASPAWTYTSEDKWDFYAQRISGVERLSNGNTLICSGPSGILFEVDKDGTQHWQYQNPYGAIRRGAPTPPGAIKNAPQQSAPARRRPDAPSPFGQRAVFKVQHYAPEYSGLESLKETTP